MIHSPNCFQGGRHLEKQRRDMLWGFLAVSRNDARNFSFRAVRTAQKVKNSSARKFLAKYGLSERSLTFCADCCVTSLGSEPRALRAGLRSQWPLCWGWPHGLDRQGLDRQRLGLDRQRLGLDRQRLRLDQQRLGLDWRRLGLDRHGPEAAGAGPAGAQARPAAARAGPAEQRHGLDRQGLGIDRQQLGMDRQRLRLDR